MDHDEAVSWIREVVQTIPVFLESIRGMSDRGFFHYTLTGDFNNKEDWGVFNSVCAARILYILNRISEEDKGFLSAHILRFEHTDGSIYDQYLINRYRIFQIRSFINPFYATTLPRTSTIIQAVTRSAYSGLHCLGSAPKKQYQKISSNKDDIEQYIHQLDWTRPWGAGSQFSGLVQFLIMNKERVSGCDRSSATELINHAFSIVRKYENNDGSWGYHHETMPDTQKINGCMKMLLAYQWADRKPENSCSLIDLSLACDLAGDGCNNLDNIVILYECSKHTDYRHDHIVSYCLDRFDTYKKHWWDTKSGFSFFEKRSIDHLYGARIADAKPEPDIHGTWLHFYGIAMMVQMCGMNEQFNLQIPLI
ncbi:MAG: hypothetical protein JXA44_09960 [Methanospirillaceae archaeon]|nr:hypothetical protein [Methanospirillaceae archaeon]